MYNEESMIMMFSYHLMYCKSGNFRKNFFLQTALKTYLRPEIFATRV